MAALAVASSQVSSSSVTKSMKPTNAREISRGLVSLTHYRPDYLLLHGLVGPVSPTQNRLLPGCADNGMDVEITNTLRGISFYSIIIIIADGVCFCFTHLESACKSTSTC